MGKEHTMHLVSILKQHYEISEDWTDNKYIEKTFDRDYCNRRVHFFMPGYTTNALQQFGHEHLQRLQNSPHLHVDSTYGKAKYVETETLTIPPKKDGQKFIQAITRTLLYYSHAIDPTMMVALNAIAMQQSSPPSHHQNVRGEFLTQIAELHKLRDKCCEDSILWLFPCTLVQMNLPNQVSVRFFTK